MKVYSFGTKYMPALAAGFAKLGDAGVPAKDALVDQLQNIGKLPGVSVSHLAANRPHLSSGRSPEGLAWYTKDEGFEPLAEAIAAIARLGDGVVVLDSGGTHRSVALATRVAEMLGCEAGHPVLDALDYLEAALKAASTEAPDVKPPSQGKKHEDLASWFEANMNDTTKS